MKKFIIEESEVKRILSMHKALIKEQFAGSSDPEPLESPAAGTPAAGTPAAGTPAAGTPAAGTPAAGKPAAPEVDPLLQKLFNAVSAGCLSNGKIYLNKTKNMYYYRGVKQSTNQEIDFFPDMTYNFVDGTKKGKWTCSKLPTAEVESLSNDVLKEKKDKEGWMEYSELTGKGYSQLEADQGKYATEKFTLKNGKVITLYKPKTGAVMGGQQEGMSNEQKAFISKFEKLKGKLKLTPEEQATQEYRQIEVPGSREVTGWEKTGLKMWFKLEDIKNITTGSELKTTIENQQISLDECKTLVDQFFTGYQDDTDIPDFEIVKRKVQRCKSLYSPNPRTGRKNRWGIFSSQKNKIDILSGLVTGQGPSRRGQDSKWLLN